MKLFHIYPDLNTKDFYDFYYFYIDFLFTFYFTCLSDL